MRFAYLTAPEGESAAIAWNEAEKPEDLVSAAISAGFTEQEVIESPVGILQHSYLAGECRFRAGARVLVGTNGSLLIELPT